MVASTILFRKSIKPSSPTPSSLRRHNLSFIDHVTNSAYVPMAAFYSKPANNYTITLHGESQTISQILEKSLSKVLTAYYPFAGRININKSCVDCNDLGAEYLNVRINCPMSEILNHAYNDAADVVFPQDLPWSSTFSDRSPLVVQLSQFDCGGIAVSVCLSHKIADGYSLCKFFNDWAATARQSVFKPTPQFDVASFFPLMDDPPAVPEFKGEAKQCVSRIVHFSSSSLSRLKDIVAMNSEVQNPTRVEVATALLHKCAVEVSRANFGGLFKPSLLVHAMSLRPPLSLNTIGNAVSHFSSIAAKDDEIQVHHVVAQQRKAKQQLRDKLKDMNKSQLASYALEKMKAGEDVLERNIFDFYFCSSMCNFALYTTDFGWGRPKKVTQTRHALKNSFVFLDNQSGDGINALITLTEADMLIFMSNKELLEFASPVIQSSE